MQAAVCSEARVAKRSGPSNKIAVGAYLRRLRDRQRMTQAQVRASVRELSGWPMNESTLIRIEGGESFPGGEMLAALLTILNGSPRDVVRLQANERATAEDGRAAADAWLDQNGVGAQIDDAFANLSDEDFDKVFRAMMNRPQPTPLLAAFRAWFDRWRRE